MPHPTREHIMAVQRTHMAETGWMLQWVFPHQDSKEQVSFSYTIGLEKIGLPELIIFGALPEHAAHILAIDVMVYIKGKIDDNETFTGLVEHNNWPMPFYLLHACKEKALDYAGWADEHSEGKATFVQVAIPDKNGRFAWEPGVSARFKEGQRVLGPV